MRQAIIIFSLSGSFILFATTIQLVDTLVMFLLFGILPGNEQPLSANQMLSIYAAATGCVALYAFRSSILSLITFLRTKSQTTSHAS